jgi:replicative DNA helicase
VVVDNSLRDPDSDDNTRYSWDEEFQRYVISMLLVDKQFLLQAIQLVKPSYFTNQAHSKACEILFNYFNEYKEVPLKTIVYQEFKDQLKNNKAISYYLSELDIIYEYFQPGIDAREYLINKITYFAKIQSLKQAFNKSLEEVNKNPESDQTWDKVYHELQKAMITDKGYDMGIEYLKDARDRYERMQEEEEKGDVFSTGLPSLDQELKGGGYRRGQSFAVMADSGVGKSVMLACITAHNAIRGKKCLYISCENSEDEIADRLDSILTGSPIRSLYAHRKEVFDKLEGKEAIGVKDDGEPVYFNKEENLIVIKKFPQKSADVNTVRAYLTQLELRGYIPDLVVIDYVGEMKDFPGMKIYESREKLIDELTGLADEKRFFLLTALQPNRDGKEAQEGFGHLGQANMADSFGQMRPLFGCLTLNQNEREAKMNCGRGWMEKQRNGRKHYQFFLNFDHDTLKISEISQQTYKDRMSSQTKSVVGNIEIDSVKVIDSKNENTIVDNVVKKYKPSEGKND